MRNLRKISKSISLLLVLSIFLSSCASTTIIQSQPNGAKIYMNGEYAGVTPYAYKDTKIVGSDNDVTLKKEGYETFKATFSRDEKVDVGAVIGGVFLLFPFFWTMKYKPTHIYELTPINE